MKFFLKMRFCNKAANLNFHRQTKFQFYLPRVIFFALTIFVFAKNLFAENLERQKILSPLVEEFLFPNDEISHIFSENDFETNLIPNTEFADLMKNFVFGKIAPEKMGFAEEKLYRLPKFEIENKNSAALDTRTVSKIMRSISKMQGMQYFSRSRKSWDKLYSQAFRVENPDANDFSAAPDLNEGDANGLEIFAFLNDHTFGESVYKISYKQNQNEFLMLMENYSALTYGPVKAVKPGDLKMCVCVIDCGDEFLFYIGNYAEFKMISALKKRLNNSFEARLEAIYNWFKNQF
ncbi:MAG: hypothetical protein HDR36_06925 [Treponema sp.]|nr:hypothetical protein [Treponema sp.]